LKRLEFRDGRREQLLPREDQPKCEKYKYMELSRVQE
jgi:hypothetical protein